MEVRITQSSEKTIIATIEEVCNYPYIGIKTTSSLKYMLMHILSQGIYAFMRVPNSVWVTDKESTKLDFLKKVNQDSRVTFYVFGAAKELYEWMEDNDQ